MGITVRPPSVRVVAPAVAAVVIPLGINAAARVAKITLLTVDSD